MNINHLTQEYISHISKINSKILIVNDINLKIIIIENDIRNCKDSLEASTIKEFMRDLLYIKDGLESSWKTDITSDHSQLYFENIQKQVTNIIS